MAASCANPEPLPARAITLALLLQCLPLELHTPDHTATAGARGLATDAAADPKGRGGTGVQVGDGRLEADIQAYFESLQPHTQG